MGRFTRSAPWLRIIYPSSEAPIEDIGDLSDQVYLTHPHVDPFGIRESNGWFSKTALFTLAAGNNFLNAGNIVAGEITRLLGANYQFGTGPTSNSRIFLSAGPSVGEVNGCLSEHVDSGITFKFGALPIVSPIIGPSHFITAAVIGATLNDTIEFTFYFVAAPRGTIFYV